MYGARKYIWNHDGVSALTIERGVQVMGSVWQTTLHSNKCVCVCIINVMTNYVILY